VEADVSDTEADQLDHELKLWRLGSKELLSLIFGDLLVPRSCLVVDWSGQTDLWV